MEQINKNLKIQRKMEKLYQMPWMEIWQKFSHTVLSEYFRESGGRCIQCAKHWVSAQTFHSAEYDVTKLICYRCKKENAKKPRWPNKCEKCKSACQRLDILDSQKLCDKCYLAKITNKNN